MKWIIKPTYNLRFYVLLIVAFTLVNVEQSNALNNAKLLVPSAFSSIELGQATIFDYPVKTTSGLEQLKPMAYVIAVQDAGLQITSKKRFEENSYKVNEALSAQIENNSLNQQQADAFRMSSGGHTLFRQGMYYGFAFMLILLNLACFFLFEEKTYLLYCLALTGTTVSLLFSEQLLEMFGIGPIFNAEAVQSVFLSIAIGTGALFASKFLSLKQFFPKLKWATATLFSAAAIFIVIGWVSNNIDMIHVANILLFSVTACYFIAGVLLFGKKNYVKFYVIATAIPLLFAIDFFVLQPFGINFLSTQSSHVRAAVLVEMLVITYAIMYRMQALKEENKIRQTELRIFLKNQEMMNRTKVEKLVEDVYLENLIMHYDLDGLEIKLLQYISEGKENAKIARKLKTTEQEIEELTNELYHKLEISEQIKEDYRIVEDQPDYIYN